MVTSWRPENENDTKDGNGDSRWIRSQNVLFSPLIMMVLLSGFRMNVDCFISDIGCLYQEVERSKEKQ